MAGDHTDWPRLAAPTLRDRKIVHAPTKIAGNRPITIGYDFSTVSWGEPEWAGSWAPPLLFERISSAETPLQKGAEQLRRISQVVPQGVRLVSLWDSEYGCAPFVKATHDIAADKLFRLRPNLCLWGQPPPYPGRGRPARHGPAFKLREPLTWGLPASKLELCDPELGRGCKVLVWRLLHFRQAADQPLVVVRIERLEAAHTARDPRRALAGLARGRTAPAGDLVGLVLAALRRGSLASVRQAGLALDAAAPGDPRAGRTLERLDAAAHRLLASWLARPLVNDVRWPWQKPQAAAHRTPGPGCVRAWQDFWRRLAHRPRGQNPAEKRRGGRPAKGACVSATSATKWSKRPTRSPKQPRKRWPIGCQRASTLTRPRRVNRG